MDDTQTELAFRSNGDIEVTLFWSRPSGRVSVSLSDLASDEVIEFAVPPEDALDAFHHPYAHLALRTAGASLVARTDRAWV